ncbi:hypothetical protein C3K47_18405 [Solitalea longa]|uniref:Uncharacterized protein n=1 Tax=Solitalea longa TaxID=2079460 RepID=A0A2S4ZWS0_9SPHI|nr:hypothetical protein [Solitalea longa]POY34811.1 hypothetical protein C3K47_18405 [Solitalea longa]
MTFEEFFAKKKIDLLALKAGMPSLYDEFKNHYEQMSEKSFDHSKKFWFNKLRLDFPLKEEPKSAPAVSNPTTETQNNPAETSQSGGGYKPLFRKKINPST